MRRVVSRGASLDVAFRQMNFIAALRERRVQIRDPQTLVACFNVKSRGTKWANL